MADEEQLKIIRQGDAAWNEWRVKNPDIKVDLWGAHLIWADLGWATLGGAYLWGANLGGAKLIRADLLAPVVRSVERLTEPPDRFN